MPRKSKDSPKPTTARTAAKPYKRKGPTKSPTLPFTSDETPPVSGAPALDPATAAARQKAEQILVLKKKGAELYTAADRLLAEMLAEFGPRPGERTGPAIPLSQSQVFRIVDPFIDAKTGQAGKAWKHSPVSRFEYEVGTL